MGKAHISWLFVLTLAAASCGAPGVVEVHRVEGSERAPTSNSEIETEEEAGECPAGWNCMDIAALGIEATDGDGEPVRASCSKGGIMPCDDADPASSCEGLIKPFCAHLMAGGQNIVSCAQRCSP
jgi:hypothetical protein